MSAKTSLLPRTWIEIDAAAARHNLRVFRRRIGPKVRLWGVVKSNAYGHGLSTFARAVEKGVDGFCVDSLIEGVRLREAGSRKPVLVIGATLPELLGEAARWGIAVSISGPHDLKAILRARVAPEFHIEVDSGFHRRGFYPEDAKKVASQIRRSRHAKLLKGIYTHFASAKDLYYPAHTQLQFAAFEKAARQFRSAGFRSLILHAAATGGTLLGEAFHGDAVRVGIGLYGYFPSSELEVQLPRVRLQPVLSWRAIVTEVKQAKEGARVGYDRTERLSRPSKIAVIPIGYWHGFPRSLSGPVGEIIVNGKRARVVGRVSMDIIVADVTGLSVRAGDVATLIGSDKRASIFAPELAAKSGTSHYEFLTRLNPLIERRIV